MITLSNVTDNPILKDFLALSHWETLVAVIAFYSILVPFFILVGRYKIKFMYRVLIGLALGLVFGVAIQAIIGFPESLVYESGNINEGKIKNEYQWIDQLNVWAQLLKQVFINGILLLTVPVVFVAIFRVTAKPNQSGIGRISAKAVFFMLMSVAVAFTVTFWIGIATNVGGGADLDNATQGQNSNPNHDSKPLPEIIWGYVPSNFISTLAGTAIIPVMVIAAVMGKSVKILSKRHKEAMDKLRFGFDRTWDIIMSMLMTFMKIMPVAVMSMITVSVTSRPIGALAIIGKVIGIGYVGIFIALLWLSLLVFLSGVKLGKWWKISWKPLIQGFATQSSNATLPVSMDAMRDEMKLDDKVVSSVGPLSTSMGLVACAGVQSGLITSFLWTGSDKISSTFSGGIAVFFVMGLTICLIASLGIAGIPGTAAVVTSGVLGGLGFPGYFAPVYAIIGALDGLFDMGRTGANVVGGLTAATITAKSEGLIADDSPILSAKAGKQQIIIREKIHVRENKKIEKQQLWKEKLALRSAKSKAKKESNLEATKQSKEQDE